MRIRKKIIRLASGMAIAFFLVGCALTTQPIPISTLPPFRSTRTAVPIFPPALTSTPEPTSIVPEVSGKLGDLISLFLKEIPDASDRAYAVPNKAEQADFSQLVTSIQSNNIQAGKDLAAQNHYVLLHFSDTGQHGSKSYLLSEVEPVTNGWGFYAFRDGSASPLLIEAPHPITDGNTPNVALDLYERLDARALLVAGALRSANPAGSADVAHAPSSIFQTIHTALLTNPPDRSADAAAADAGAAGAVVLQIHGYAIEKHPGYPRVVLGLGREPGKEEVALARKIAAALEARGVSAGICDGTAWKDLCATKNTQSATMAKGIFIQVELDETVRADDTNFLGAMTEVFSQ